MVMVIKVDSELEAVLNAQAAMQGVQPESLALAALRERFLKPVPAVVPQDEWERQLLSAASDCGVSLPHSALSSDGLYE
jgi:hypothetical protein